MPVTKNYTTATAPTDPMLPEVITSKPSMAIAAHLRRGFLRSVVLVALVPESVLVSHAQEGALSDDGLEEVIVTARRVPENLQETPLAVTVLDGGRLEAAGVEDLSDLNGLGPNLNIAESAPLSGTSSAASIFVRGIGQSDFVNTAEPAVAIYIDGVYLPRMVGSLVEIVDARQVEILRGPQGALFGRNSIGGAVTISSRRPDRTHRSGRVRIGAGEQGFREARLTFNTPLAEKFATRLSLVARGRDGYVDAAQYDDLELGEDRVVSGRWQLRWLPSESVTADFGTDWVRERESPAAVVPRTIGSLDGATRDGPYTGDGAVFNATLAANPACATDSTLRRTDRSCYGEVWNNGTAVSNAVWVDGEGNVVRPRNELDSTGVDAHIRWLGDFGELVYIGAYRTMHSVFRNDFDFSPYLVDQNNNVPFDDDHHSHEIRISSDWGTRGQVGTVLGFYEFGENGTEIAQLVRVSPVGDAATAGTVQTGIRDIDNEARAVFASATWRIGARFRLSAGSRYTRSEKRLRLALVRPSGVLGPIFGRQVATEYTPGVALSWHPNGLVMAYASRSKGFRDGGFPTRFATGFPDEIPYFDPEYVVADELGLKIDTASHRLRVNLAVFRSRYRDMQIAAAVANPGGESLTSIDNLGDAKISGLEFELSALAGRRTRLEWRVGLLADAIESVLGGTLRSASFDITTGNELPFTPAFNSTLSLTHDFVLPDGSELELRLSRRDMGDQFYRIENCPDCYEPAYHVGDLSATYRPAGTTWRVGLIGRNVTNESYSTFASFSGLDAVTFANVSRPASWDVSFAYDFGR